MNDQYIFTLSKRWVQNCAIEQLGRKLNEKELIEVSKGIESGLHFDLETVIRTVFDNIDSGKYKLN